MTDTNGKSVQKQKRGLETTRAILDTAADLFARSGYEGVSVRSIAQGAGIRESSLYNHFSSKAAILEALYADFIRRVPESRPSQEDIDRMLPLMSPQEVFKAILFHVGQRVGGTLSNTAMIINYEKFRSARAADMYYQYVVHEPTDYYERLIRKMIDQKMVKPVDAHAVAEQYNYVSIALTKEYIMAQYGLADAHAAVGSMIRTIRFFCESMAWENGDEYEKEKKSADSAGKISAV